MILAISLKQKKTVTAIKFSQNSLSALPNQPDAMNYTVSF